MCFFFRILFYWHNWYMASRVPMCIIFISAHSLNCTNSPSVQSTLLNWVENHFRCCMALSICLPWFSLKHSLNKMLAICCVSHFSNDFMRSCSILEHMNRASSDKILLHGHFLHLVCIQYLLNENIWRGITYLFQFMEYMGGNWRKWEEK